MAWTSHSQCRGHRFNSLFRSFKLDRVLHDASQDLVYETVAKDVVSQALNGFIGNLINCCFNVRTWGTPPPRKRYKDFMVNKINNNFSY